MAIEWFSETVVLYLFMRGIVGCSGRRNSGRQRELPWSLGWSVGWWTVCLSVHGWWFKHLHFRRNQFPNYDITENSLDHFEVTIYPISTLHKTKTCLNCVAVLCNVSGKTHCRWNLSWPSTIFVVWNHSLALTARCS